MGCLMQPYELTEAQRLAHDVEYLREAAYSSVCPPMNRAQRRTAKGKMLVAYGELAAHQAEMNYLRDRMQELLK